MLNSRPLTYQTGDKKMMLTLLQIVFYMVKREGSLPQELKMKSDLTLEKDDVEFKSLYLEFGGES